MRLRDEPSYVTMYMRERCSSLAIFSFTFLFSLSLFSLFLSLSLSLCFFLDSRIFGFLQKLSRFISFSRRIQDVEISCSSSSLYRSSRTKSKSIDRNNYRIIIIIIIIIMNLVAAFWLEVSERRTNASQIPERSKEEEEKKRKNVMILRSIQTTKHTYTHQTVISLGSHCTLVQSA